MSKKKGLLGIFGIACLIMLFYASCTLSQGEFERRGQRRSGGTGPGRGRERVFPGPEGSNAVTSRRAITGEVRRVDSERIVVLTERGIEEELIITPRTDIVKEAQVEGSLLKEGDNVLLIGSKTREGVFSASIVRITEQIEETRRKPPSHLQVSPSRERGMEGPLLGVITGLKPFTVKTDSGDEVVVKLLSSAKIVKEVEIILEDLKPGHKVRIILSSAKERKEARKVILLDAGETEQPEIQEIQPSSTEKGSALDYMNSPFGFRDSPPQLQIYSYLHNRFVATGIKLAAWEDIEKTKGVYDFAQTDRALSHIIDNGQNVLVELRPINKLYGTSFHGNEYPDGYLEEYANFIKAFVERYDGDGVADAPGSPVIRYYQFVHEVPPKTSKIPMFWRENPKKYAELFKLTYDTIKGASSDCKIYLVGGFLYDYEQDGFFSAVFREFQARKYKFYGIGFDYHYWSQIDSLQDALNSTGTDYRAHKEYVDKIRSFYKSFGYGDDEVEISTLATGMSGTFKQEKYQAIYLLKTHVFGLSLNLKKIFWSHSSDTSRGIGKLFRYTGLIHNQQNEGGYSHKKLSYYTYQLMVKKLEDCNLNNVETVLDGQDYVYAYRFRNERTGMPIYVMWWDWFKKKDQKEKTVSFDFGSKEVIVSTSVPEGQNALRITDEKAVFAVERHTTDPKTGKVEITLKESPIYVEQENLPEQ